MRATSTVLDAAVFLLLVTVAVGTLVAPVARSPAPSAHASARVVATTTASVNYSLGPVGRDAPGSDTAATGPAFDRAAHGTLASLLASAAAGNLTVDGVPVAHTGDGFERAAVLAVENATRRRVAVRAVWAPYPGAPIRGQVRAGPRPPPGADVAAVTLRVRSRFPAARGRALAAARSNGYAGVARVVANATVDGLFPLEVTRLALRGDSPVDALTARRYRRFAGALGTDVAGPVSAAAPRRANRRLVRALATRLEADLRSSYRSPAAAARAVGVGEVRVVVRRWSA